MIVILYREEHYMPKPGAKLTLFFLSAKCFWE